MNLSSFDYFAVLARERSFTKAAQQLHITQQSLSAHIAALEEELGCQLVVRHVPLELTYAGTVFLRYAETIQGELNSMHREFCDITHNQKGVLRIGIAFTRGRAIMPALIPAFQAFYPNIEIQLSEGANQALYYKLLDGEVDLAIANFPNAIPNAELCDFYREEVVLLIAKSLLEQLFGKETGKLADELEKGNLASLRDCPFVLGSLDDIAGKMGRTMIERSGFAPIVKAQSDNIETLLSLCFQGVGACFSPINLVSAAVLSDDWSRTEVFHLGRQAEYPIRFGFLKSNYQWKIISEFIRISRQTIRNGMQA